MPVTREEIVAAAIKLLDEAGLEGVTLRRLAERLGIRAPTLYWHVRDKRELLDLMADTIMSEALTGWRQPRPGQPWWEWLAGLARNVRSALLAHRDSALALSGNMPVPQTFPAIEKELQTLAEAGFPPRHALMTLRVISAYVVGEVLDAQGQADRARPQEQQGARARAASPHDAPPLDAGRDPAAFPLLLAAAGAAQTPDQRFEHGLGLIIAGLRAQLAQAQAGGAGQDPWQDQDSRQDEGPGQDRSPRHDQDPGLR